MTYMLVYETLNSCLTFMAILFIGCIVCEWLQSDMKLLYQGIILFINAAIGIVCGWALFTNNIVYSGGMTMQYPPLGFFIATLGALCFLLAIVIWLPRVLSPYGHAGASFQVAPRAPQTPRKPGMF
jgi:hypothetical protein